MSLRSLVYNPHLRATVMQLGLLVLVVAVAAILISNTLHNLESRNIQTGFDFLTEAAGFRIGETALPFTPSSSYGKAILIGLLNTLKVSAFAIVFSTLLGIGVGIARLSTNWILKRLTAVYVEVIRNVPLLLQLFVWYALITEALPANRMAVNLGDMVFLSNRGIFFPTLSEWTAFGPVLDIPVLKGFNFVGGGTITPEFFALVVGLSVYTSAYIAEIVRAGILSVPKGQREAAASLGLSSFQAMRKIILPQALRIAVPPVTSWYLNTVKNSSLAIVVGYPDLVSVIDTSINQTGQAIEGVAVIMVVYLSISLSIAAFMNWYNTRVARFGPVGGNIAKLPQGKRFDLLTRSGILAWLKHNFFSNPINSLLSVLLAVMVIWGLWVILDWAVLSSSINGGAQACREATGACWAFIAEKYSFILFGTYPYEEQWRPSLAVSLFLVLTCVSFYQRFWRPALFIGWLAVIGAMLLLMGGGVLGLSSVPTSLWGGLPVTLILAVLAILVGLPIGILLALGRISDLRIVRLLCTTYIEIIRGVPLISVLFMAAVMFPLFMPESLTIDNFLRVQTGLILFAAAYMAEVVRGGLQAVPKGQYEGASALGLTYWQSMRKVILPQALRVSIPAMVNTFISEVKNTTLVLIVGIFDLLHATKTALADPEWRIFYKEAFLFTGLLFFLICLSLSWGSQMLERKINNRECH